MLQDWALGVLHAKIIAAITLMGPQWWLKTVIEQVRLRRCSLYQVIRASGSLSLRKKNNYMNVYSS